MTIRTTFSTTLAAIALALTLTACNNEEPAAPASTDATPSALQSGLDAVDDAKEVVAAAYPLDVCVVSGHKFGSGGMESVVVEHEGRSVTLCCEGCIDGFKKEPAKYIAILDKSIAGQTPAVDTAH